MARSTQACNRTEAPVNATKTIKIVSVFSAIGGLAQKGRSCVPVWQCRCAGRRSILHIGWAMPVGKGWLGELGERPLARSSRGLLIGLLAGIDSSCNLHGLIVHKAF